MQSKRTEQQQESKSDGASLGVGDVMELNGLKYRIPQPLSSAVARSYKREFAQKGTYLKSNTMVFDWNTGTSYVNPDTAMLSFKFNLTQAAAANATYHWSGSLGGAALFQEIRIISKNGVEVSRIQEAALLSKIIVDYAVSESGKQMLEMAQGFSAASRPVVVNPLLVLPVDLECVIPMKYISGFFRPTIDGMLIPAGLASGLRIEIQLVADPSVALVCDVATTVSAFEVTDAAMLLETSDLNDPTQAALLQESASNGLEYTYPEYYSTSLSTGTSATSNIQINKAVSQGTRMFLAVQDVLSATPAVEVLVDSYASLPGVDISKYQFRVGQMYFPNQVVDKATEKLSYAQSAMEGLKQIAWAPNTVSFDNYFAQWANTSAVTEEHGKAIVAASLETSDRLNLSGLPLNNSSTGECRLTMAAAAPGNVRGSLFLEYIAVAKVSGNRTQLKI